VALLGIVQGEGVFQVLAGWRKFAVKEQDKP
jgi:hypothetical protein